MGLPDRDSQQFQELDEATAVSPANGASNAPEEAVKPPGMSLAARAFIGLMIAAGLSVLAWAAVEWESHDLTRFACFLGIAWLASGLKVTLRAITGTLSVNFPFIMIAIVELTLPEALVLGCSATLLQCLWRTRKRPRPVQVAFNVAGMALAIAAAEAVFHGPGIQLQQYEVVLRLVVAAVTFFLANTLPVSVVIRLTEFKPILRVWRECYFWSFPYYLLAAAGAGIFHLANLHIGWEMSLLVLPVIYLIYRSYRLYLERLDDERDHAEEMASLHLRTIEALALAIEAKDDSTHDHLQRVQVYAREVGRELGLSENELEALHAASVLHDIGKLAVPEHIISKPGRLTPEEFEKMKIHPVVGAEILEQVQFPYPVAPIVRAHHEKWDGTGYPDGIAGENIPVGARILAAVDCLDALASDRQYRKALPLEEALGVVKSESGKAFDPAVVEVLERRCKEFERIALAEQSMKARGRRRAKLSKHFRVRRGEAPAAGFEAAAGRGGKAEAVDFLSSIAAARQEVQALFELSQDLGNSLSLDETLSVLAVRLKRMVPYDSMAIYVRRGERLVPEFVTGDNFRLFSSLEIPLGQGLSGWVAENRKPIVNGNPSVEPGYLNDPSRFTTMRSALAVPLEAVNGVVGVLALYHGGKDAFTRDNLRILLAISSKVAISIENALKFRQAERSATTDYLTGLPNARSLFLHLDSELARCRRTKQPLTVLVCDLDGFKQVNDRFGHLEGNRVLQVVAAGLKEICREYDYVARMGGDEFVLVLPGLRREDLEAKASRLVEVAVAAGREVCGEDLLSLSLGHAHFPPDGLDAEQLLAEADRRMYKAKHRNKTARAAKLPAWALEWQATVQ